MYINKIINKQRVEKNETHYESYLFIPVPRPKKKEQESLGHPTLYLFFQAGNLYFFSEAT